ncbi:MAG: hypothetical protein H0T73_13035, partial [Ardenticatenales bacterium]|nr:hypothetical protein [Ardenticatenales bacterium]
MPSVHHLEEISTHLKRVPFLAALTSEQRAFLAERARIRTYPSRARLVLEGTYGDTLFIIHEGEVEVFVRRHGQKITLGRRTA